MNITHILGSLGMGGAERVVLDLAATQTAHGHRVAVLSLAGVDGPLAAEFRNADIALHSIPKEPGLDWRLPGKIAGRNKALQSDVVHTHNTQPLLYGAAACRLAGFRVVHTKHGQGHLVSTAAQMLRRIASPFVHEFVAVSETTAKHAKDQWAYPYPSRIRVIPNGVRLDKHQPDPKVRRHIRQSLEIPEEAWVVGTIGRLDDNKNQSALLRAMDCDLSPNVHLIIVGDGETMPALQSMRSDCAHPESVHLLGRRNDAHKLMAALDLFALCSRSEGLPLVILEAMATEVPIVTTSVGGIPDVVQHGKNGLLVDNSDDALRAALQQIQQNPSFGRQLAAGGRNTVQQEYSVARMNDRYMELYR